MNEILLRHQWPYNKLHAMLTSCMQCIQVLVSFWSCPELELAATQFAIDAANQHKVVRCDVTQWQGLIQFYPYTYWLSKVFVTSSDRCIVWMTSPHFGGWRHGSLSLWEKSVTDWLSHDKRSQRHSPGCQGHYWSLCLQEEKNSICFVHVVVICKVTSVFYFR